MSYAYIRKAPFDLETHRAVRKQVGPEAPDGLLVHLVFQRGEELEFIDVWDTEHDWERFWSERLGPAVQAVQSDHGAAAAPLAAVSSTPIQVVDLLVGSVEAVAALSVV
jgi:hypothetical protein